MKLPKQIESYGHYVVTSDIVRIWISTRWLGSVFRDNPAIKHSSLVEVPSVALNCRIDEVEYRMVNIHENT